MNPFLEKLFRRPEDAHKYDFGHVLVIGGAPGMVGAPFLAAKAALRTGAGLVTIASQPNVVDKLEHRVEEIMTLRLYTKSIDQQIGRFVKERKVSVIIIGPGMSPRTALIGLKFLLSLNLPLIIDGGALSALKSQLDLLNRAAAKIILTPHGGEYKKLTELPGKEFTKKYSSILVLKGSPTRVFNSNGEDYVNSTGGPALATAGSGDVLCGMIAALISQGIDYFAAARAGVYLHGLAGNIAAKYNTTAGVIASDVIEAVPKALKVVETKSTES